ncbi:MAG: hypothetical protein R3A12_08090 [Ignavibacteria bacterium]|nr:hypothetical protein [Ignavibacteriota bacterium]
MKSKNTYSGFLYRRSPNLFSNDYKKLISLFFLLLLMISFYSCGGGIPSAEDQTINYKPVVLNSYSVNYPVGNGWKSERDRSSSKVIFTRDKSSTSTDIFGILAGVGSDGYTFISIMENQLKEDSVTINWGETETAEDYMNNEVKIMKKEGVKTGMYKLKNILKTDTIINDKKFYCMDYEQYAIKTGGNSYFYSENKLALYFPVNYKDTRKFYVFLICDYSNSFAIGMDTGQLFPVLASFKLKDEAL